MSRREEYVLSDLPAGAPVPWASIETREATLANANELRARRAAEFSAPVPQGLDPVSRRSFLSIMGASVALATMEGCRRPVERILPYARPPEGVVPGVAQHYATVINRRGEALGLLVESHEGRPTKIEGNPDHPASAGKADMLAQASVLDLYDPDRSRQPSERGHDKSWAEFDQAFTALLATHASNGGQGLRVLAPPTNSPTFVRLRGEVLRRFPQAKFHTYEAASLSNVREGTRLALGAPANALYDFARSKVILALDSDFLQTEPGMVRNTLKFAQGRGGHDPSAEMSRLYVVEPVMSTTGANADHRLRLASRDVEGYLLALAARLGGSGADLTGLGDVVRGAAPPAGVPAHWIEAVAADLLAHRGACALVVGPRQPARVHALAHALNHALGNVGQTVNFAPVVDAEEPDPAQGGDLRGLCQAIDASQVQTLVILGGNPVYDAPGDLGFAQKLARVANSVHLSLFRDETSSLCTWHVAAAHYLESWGDQQSLDGTVSIQQPLIAPLYWGRSEIEVLASMADLPARGGHDLVRATVAAGAAGQAGLERAWRRALHRGAMESAQAAPAAPAALQDQGVAAQLRARPPVSGPLGQNNVEVVFLTDNKMLDGRHANNAWLQEMPDPVTKLTWDNAAYVSLTTARALGLDNGDIVRLSKGNRSIEVAAWILPGQADWVVGLPLGWGRSKAGRVGNGQGFDVNPLRASDAMHFFDGVAIAKTGAHYEFSQTQEHHRMEGRAIALEATLAEFQHEPRFAAERSPTPRTLPLWREVNYDDRNKWGMVIDLNACTGCNACAVACQSENNVPVVGKEQVARGREMHWIRVDRYFVGTVEDPSAIHQPLMCVQCEEAPCENVCPVNATAHSPEGLNDMAYNRCIGTRYCSNNCPYKVRRFNYLNWHNDGAYQRNVEGYGHDADVPQTVRMQHNPNVTVRFRGVMEKCTYCVQRIQSAKINAKREGRVHETPRADGPQLRVDLRDGEVTTACAQTCPADAIVFGDLNNPEHRVTQLARNNRNYKLLAELGTQPRTSYLARVRNINPAMGHAAGAEAHG